MSLAAQAEFRIFRFETRLGQFLNRPPISKFHRQLHRPDAYRDSVVSRDPIRFIPYFNAGGARLRFSRLVSVGKFVKLQAVKEKSGFLLAIVLMAGFALTRWPGLMPENFSTAYALAFCAGVYFPKRWAWILPIATLAVTDLALNLYYHAKFGTPIVEASLLANYVAYAVLIWLGSRFQPRSSFGKLLTGGIFGAILFYLITNTIAWFFNPFQNPEYTRNFSGWFIALTLGAKGWPETWRFLLNTLFSSGLFTGLFVGAMKFTTQAESEREKQAPEGRGVEESDGLGEGTRQPASEEAKA